jgi:hypothetical protein
MLPSSPYNCTYITFAHTPSTCHKVQPVHFFQNKHFPFSFFPLRTHNATECFTNKRAILLAHTNHHACPPPLLRKLHSTVQNDRKHLLKPGGYIYLPRSQCYGATPLQGRPSLKKAERRKSHTLRFWNYLPLD